MKFMDLLAGITGVSAVVGIPLWFSTQWLTRRKLKLEIEALEAAHKLNPNRPQKKKSGARDWIIGLLIWLPILSGATGVGLLFFDDSPLTKRNVLLLAVFIASFFMGWIFSIAQFLGEQFLSVHQRLNLIVETLLLQRGQPPLQPPTPKQ